MIKYNNIIYYNENKNNKFYKSLMKDCYLFEKEISGALILCRNIDSFEIVLKEIIKEKKLNNNIIFNLITTGSTFDNIMELLLKNKEYENCFEHICIYCYNLKKYEHFKKKYQNKINNDIYNYRDDIIQFIKRNSNSKIKPFKINKIINHNNYDNKYKKKYNTMLLKYIDAFNEKNNKKWISKIN